MGCAKPPGKPRCASPSNGARGGSSESTIASWPREADGRAPRGTHRGRPSSVSANLCHRAYLERSEIPPDALRIAPTPDRPAGRGDRRGLGQLGRDAGGRPRRRGDRPRRGAARPRRGAESRGAGRRRRRAALRRRRLPPAAEPRRNRLPRPRRPPHCGRRHRFRSRERKTDRAVLVLLRERLPAGDDDLGPPAQRRVLFLLPQSAFETLGGIREDLVLNETHDLAIRSRSIGRFVILPIVVETSMRRFRTYGYLRTILQEYVASTILYYATGRTPRELFRPAPAR